jgi:hypothetical protein
MPASASGSRPAGVDLGFESQWRYQRRLYQSGPGKSDTLPEFLRLKHAMAEPSARLKIASRFCIACAYISLGATDYVDSHSLWKIAESLVMTSRSGTAQYWFSQIATIPCLTAANAH